MLAWSLNIFAHKQYNYYINYISVYISVYLLFLKIFRSKQFYEYQMDLLFYIYKRFERTKD